ncbi:16S rRNA (adenine(1518)-N(6)/adenine(1519)-N(6))-dimethyltransferase RsmA [Caproicibacterium amylolyticum]|uniref:Ribosomal RNA small subunit methyltransferase A n=1 Tax=Caproicibacterium amylolyticum TaxID=2766537 RepID=A0A7G9WL21_9FIRM|nr:16S rRNA (adenine(1518)-N(6)/adenine(1519)-N(6))-dimethyltransferase RsmA [Caproicibacterium amylolyticum]MBE6721135.1 16S rRNA (adenine(1518)-N(6)/adenine(1519)-N(6))-dimethyltransferase RsmA [Oscillospiraceae bacterium]QNO19383.1 16S rRNA (adenine(1518)-N(6)/adenine(1519)-N(6))-dimethyltransferase RsmA [Caproicibacterium amylolyticum]
MMDLSNINTIRAILSRHGFTFSKKLGQNFLINPTVCPRMAEACGAGAGTGVLEVGPGIGVLTTELAARAEKVCAVELDSRLLPVLSETLAEHHNVHVVQGDVMELDLHTLLEQEFGGLKIAVCANLPYYITSPVIMKLLQDRLPVDSLTVMVQKEAAERLCAEPGTRACGAVSAAVWYYAEPELLFPVGRGSFLPSPNVDSAVIQLRVRQKPPVEVANEAFFFRVVKAAFGQRRKAAANSISAGLSVPKSSVQAALQSLSLPEKLRAEQFTLEQFAELSNALYSA